MPRKKNYRASTEPAPHSTQCLATRSATIVFSDILGPSDRALQLRSLSFSSWLDRGIDGWVWATIDAMEAMLRSGSRSTATVRSHGESMKTFFAFLMTGLPSGQLQEVGLLRPAHVLEYAAWLQQEAEVRNWTVNTSRLKLQSFKSVVRQIALLRTIGFDLRRLFPARVLPSGNVREAGFRALSDGEQQRLANAIRMDLANVHHGRLRLNPSEIMANRFLVVAMRTGANETPLLELTRDALRPGLLPGTMRLRTIKYRGYHIHERALARGNRAEHPTLIPMDAVAVLERTLAETEVLLADAPPSLRNRVWLHRSMQSQEYGQVACLTRTTLNSAIGKLVRRHDLRGDDGSSLTVNLSRLRKSFAKRAFRLSGGDVVTTARLMGNTPQVADINYLRVDEQLKTEGAKYIGSELVGKLRGDGLLPRTVPMLPSDAQPPTRTPIASCRDTLHGEFAPNDGTNHCDLFVMCLFCPSSAVVGEEQDLWRLYSYQIFMVHELKRLEEKLAIDGEDVVAKRYVELYRKAIPFIEQFVPRSFGVPLASRAKLSAQAKLHPFWEYQLRRTRIQNPIDPPDERRESGRGGVSDERTA